MKESSMLHGQSLLKGVNIGEPPEPVLFEQGSSIFDRGLLWYFWNGLVILPDLQLGGEIFTRLGISLGVNKV